MSLALIPQPHRIQKGKGRLKIPARVSIGISSHDLFPTAQEALTLFERGSIHIGLKSARDIISIRKRRGLKSGGYQLAIKPEGMTLDADTASAAFTGLQTLIQIKAQSPAGVFPCMVIHDWPDFEDRGVYYDVCRGRVPRLEQLMQMAETLAHYKINQLQLYIEHTFSFRGHPDIGKNASPLTAEDILKLDAYCRENHIELVPSLACFGHMANVLKHPQYHHLAEDWGKGRYLDPDAQKVLLGKKHIGWTLSPANPKVYRFLDSLFAEFLPLFSSDRFNVCCDETWDLGLGQSYSLCRKLGKGRVYLGHILRLNELCRKYGKRMMFWGDIIRKYPELIPEIPKDVILLDWAYDFNHNFDSIRDFKKAGLDCYACPGTSSWVSLFPRLHVAEANIAGFAGAGRKYGAKGLLNTDWGDGGHYNFMEYSWHGYLFGAEQSWNSGADRKSFTARFCKLFLNIDEPDLVRAIEELGDITQLSAPAYYQSVWQHVFFACPADPVFQMGAQTGFVSRKGRISRRRICYDSRLGQHTLERLHIIRNVFLAHERQRSADPLKVLPYWVFAVDTLRHAARKLSVLGQGGADTPSARSALKREMASLMKRFHKLWLARNRPSEIRITLKAYRRAIRGL